jgi:hypothetical protein
MRIVLLTVPNPTSMAEDLRLLLIALYQKSLCLCNKPGCTKDCAPACTHSIVTTKADMNNFRFK